jgi:hypothetical protein
MRHISATELNAKLEFPPLVETLRELFRRGVDEAPPSISAAPGRRPAQRLAAAPGVSVGLIVFRRPPVYAGSRGRRPGLDFIAL